VPVGALSNVVAVSAGSEHNLALLADGRVMAWGLNSVGELGADPAGPEICGASTPCSKVPIQVPGLSDVVAIDAGYGSNLALLADGRVMAWGFDYSGQVGDGVGIQTGCYCVDHPVQVAGVAGAMAISMGEEHGTAVLADGSVRVWGEDHEGQVGNGTTVDEPPPLCLCVAAMTSVLPGRVQQIAAGSYHNVAVLGGGSLQSWGYNVHGELGNGTMTPAEGCECIPTPGGVSGISGVQTLSAGYQHTVALLGDGTVRAWGENHFGQVGDGTETDRDLPTPVSGLGGVSDVGTGEATSYALVGPAHTLTVALVGAGAGVVGGPAGIVCPPVNCANRFADGQVEVLRAEAAPGSGFAGFTGACVGTGPCQVRMDGDKTVTATFGPPKGTAITAAKIKQGKKLRKRARRKRKPKPTASASFSFTTPGVVSGYECMLVRPKARRKRHRHHKRQRLIRKRAKPRFVACSSPQRYKHLKKGRYTFRVRALNSLGIESVPAIRKFRIKR
jgi:hypothetical protein